MSLCRHPTGDCCAFNAAEIINSATASALNFTIAPSGAKNLGFVSNICLDRDNFFGDRMRQF